MVNEKKYFWSGTNIGLMNIGPLFEVLSNFFRVAKSELSFFHTSGWLCDARSEAPARGLHPRMRGRL
jgi:hypothetical protein